MNLRKIGRYLGLLLAVFLVASCSTEKPTSSPTAALTPSTTPTLQPASTHTLPATLPASTLTPSPVPSLTPTPLLPLSLVPQGARLRLSKGQMHWLSRSPDGSSVFIASDAVVCSFRIVDGLENWCIPAGVEADSRLAGLALNPQGNELAAITQGNTSTTIFWDAAKGVELGRIEVPGSYLSSLDWSPDGRLLAVSAQDANANKIQLIDPGKRELQSAIPTGDFLMSALAWSPDGKSIAAGDQIGQVSLWRIGADKPVFEKKAFGTFFQVTDLAWLPDGTSILASSIFYSCYENCTPSYDGSILQLEAQSGETQQRIPVGQGVNYFSLNPDGKRIAAVLNWKEIRLFDLSTQTRLPAKTAAPAAAGILWMPDGEYILTTAGDDSLIVWDGVESQPKRLPLGGFGAYAAVAWSPDSNQLAAVSIQGDIHIWNAHTGVALPAFGKGDYNPLLDWSPDGSQLATSDQKNLYIWNAASHEQISQYPSVGKQIVDLGWSPDGRYFATLDYGLYLAIRDAKSWRILRSIQANPQDLRLAWSPDGNQVATAGYGVSVWDVSTGAQVKRYDRDISSAGIHWSPDGSRLSVSDGNGLTLLDVQNGKETQITIRDQWIGTIAFSPDGKILAVGGKSITLYDLDSQKTLLTLSGIANLVYYLSFSPDGKTIASVTSEGTILLWTVPPPP